MGYHSWETTKEMYMNFNKVSRHSSSNDGPPWSLLKLTAGDDMGEKWIYIGSAVYILSVFTAKAAILMLFSRIFAVHHHVARAMHFLIALLFLTLLPIECMKVAVCRPVSVYWEMSTTPDELAKHCVDQGTLFKADITVSIMTDFMILIIPMPLVFSLSFTLWKKIRILLSLATGSGAVGAALYKGIVIFRPSSEHDPTKNYASLTVLTCVYLPAFLPRPE